MVSFTGSTRAGIAGRASARADTVKRVAQELGGKSANIILDDADLAKAVTQRRRAAASATSGQSCNAPTRMLVPARAARRGGRRSREGRRRDGQRRRPARRRRPTLGPVVSKMQFDKIQGLIETGIDEGATLVTGGPGRPDGLEPRLLRASRPCSPT